MHNTIFSKLKVDEVSPYNISYLPVSVYSRWDFPLFVSGLSKQTDRQAAKKFWKIYFDKSIVFTFIKI